MDAVNLFLENNLSLLVIILCVITVISLLWNIILSVQLAGLNKKYKKFMRGTTGKNIEAVLLENLENLSANDEKFEAVHKQQELLLEQLESCIQKHGVIRYNAFNDTGSDLSYSIALLNNYNSGVVFTGIYGRNEFIGYAKPVENGVSSYPLSVEEQMAIDRCQKSKINNKS